MRRFRGRVLTSSSQDQDINTAYSLGANSYIIKPVDFEKFMKVVEQIELYWMALNTPPDNFEESGS